MPWYVVGSLTYGSILYPAPTFAKAEAYARTVNGYAVHKPFATKQAANFWAGGVGMYPPPKPGSPVKKPKQQQQKKKKPPTGALIVAAARSWLGVPYLYGGTTRQGVDCSGLVMNVAHEVGITSCPRTSEEQWAWCQHIPASQVGAGDLVFFTGAEIDPPPGHVGIVVAPGTMIDAPFTGTVVRYDHYTDGVGVNKIIGYGRMVGATYSKTANLATGGGGGSSATGAGAAPAAATAVAAGGGVMLFAVIVLVVIIFAALLAAGLLFASA